MFTLKVHNFLTQYYEYTVIVELSYTFNRVKYHYYVAYARGLDKANNLKHISVINCKIAQDFMYIFTTDELVLFTLILFM